MAIPQTRRVVAGLKNHRGGQHMRQRGNRIGLGADGALTASSITTISFPLGSRPWISQLPSARMSFDTLSRCCGHVVTIRLTISPLPRLGRSMGASDHG